MFTQITALVFVAVSGIVTANAESASVYPKTLHLHQAWGTGVEHTDFRLSGGEFKWQSLPFQCNGQTYYYQVELKGGPSSTKEVFVRIGTQESIDAGRFVTRVSANQFGDTQIKIWGPDCPEITVDGDSRSGIDFVLMP